MPKLWDETIDAHRRAVRDATLDATAALVAEHGLRAVTMSQIAQAAGIGRATLYKYFPDVDAILTAWHEQRVRGHLEQLSAIEAGDGSAAERLEAVLGTYASIQHAHRGNPLAALLHQGPHVARARGHLEQLIGALVAAAAADGEVRDDVPPSELAHFCLHALDAASTLPSKAAVRRLVSVTCAGLRRG